MTARSTRLQGLAEGAPVLIGRDGQVYRKTLRQHHVPLLDMERALREADCDVRDMKYAFLEADGGISVLKESSGAVRPGGGAVGEIELPRCRRALLLIDLINSHVFPEAGDLAGPALRAARVGGQLARVARAQGVPVIYANDNFGRWRSDFSTLVCARAPGGRRAGFARSVRAHALPRELAFDPT